MPKLMKTHRPIGVLTFAGRDVDGLADGIMNLVTEDIERVGAYRDYRLRPIIRQDFAALADEVEAERNTILQIVSHANKAGEMSIEDIWGHLELDKAALSALLKSHGIEIALITTCFGGRIAEELVGSGAVKIAIGVDLPLPFAAAQAFSQGFHRSLARGLTIQRAFDNAKARALSRSGAEHAAFHLFARKDRHAEKAVLARPELFLIGSDSLDPGVIDALCESVAPHRAFHPTQLDEGDDVFEALTVRLEMARMIVMLFDGERVRDQHMLTQAQVAVARAWKEGVRIFPMYLRGTEPSLKIPYGWGRVKPLYFRDERYGGEMTRVGATLKRLLES